MLQIKNVGGGRKIGTTAINCWHRAAMLSDAIPLLHLLEERVCEADHNLKEEEERWVVCVCGVCL